MLVSLIRRKETRFSDGPRGVKPRRITKVNGFRGGTIYRLIVADLSGILVTSRHTSVHRRITHSYGRTVQGNDEISVVVPETRARVKGRGRTRCEAVRVIPIRLSAAPIETPSEGA